MAEKKSKQAEETPVEEAAQPPVRDSGPGEEAPGEPGGSPAEEEAAPEEPVAEAEPATEAEAPEPEAEQVPEGEPVAETAAEEEAAVEEAAPAAEPVGEELAEAATEAPAEAAVAPTAPAGKPKKKRLPRRLRRQRSKARRERPAERKPIVRLPKPEGERGRRQERRGVVVSTGMDKTIVVRVDTVKAHPKYKKIVRHSKNLHAHDEENRANVGDVVRVVETRPLSKTKRWRLAEVVEEAK